MCCASWREILSHITAYAHGDRVAVRPGDRVRHWWQRQATSHQPVSLLCRPLSTITARPLSPCVAGMGAPCHAPLSPQSVAAPAHSINTARLAWVLPCPHTEAGRTWHRSPPRSAASRHRRSPAAALMGLGAVAARSHEQVWSARFPGSAEVTRVESPGCTTVSAPGRS
jgi:hypothetical protein